MNITSVLANQAGLDDFATLFDEEVEQFLMLLKLLPIRTQGRFTAKKRLNFNDTVDRLLVYNKVVLVVKIITLSTEWFHIFIITHIYCLHSLESH